MRIILPAEPDFGFGDRENTMMGDGNAMDITGQILQNMVWPAKGWFRIHAGGVRAVIAESVLVKHQVLILNRSRRRAPNLRIVDRLIAGFCSLWIGPKRRTRLAITFK